MILFSIYTRTKTHQMRLDSTEEAQRVMDRVAKAMDEGGMVRFSLRNGQLSIHGGEIVSANWSNLNG